MNYLEFKQKRENGFSSLPIFFAFNKEQFEEGIKKLGLEKDQTFLIVSIGGGGYIRRKDIRLIKKSINDSDNEFSELMKKDDFFIEALVYELGNHEFGYTYDPTDALASLNLNMDFINSDEHTKYLFACAKSKYFEGENS